MSTSLDQLINSRRSIRKYKPEAPPPEWIESMVRAAAMAPSPSNSRPVRFIRIIDAGVRNRLHQVMEDGWKQIMDALVETGSHRRLQNRVNTYYRFSEFMFTAPVLFAVGAADTGPTLAQRLRTAGVDKEEHGRQRDVDITVGMAVNTMILKGEELGLGSCILTMPLFFMNHAESKSTETILKMEDMTVRCFVTVGYPDEIPAEIDRKEFFEIYREL